MLLVNQQRVRQWSRPGDVDRVPVVIVEWGWTRITDLDNGLAQTDDVVNVALAQFHGQKVTIFLGTAVVHDEAIGFGGLELEPNRHVPIGLDLREPQEGVLIGEGNDVEKRVFGYQLAGQGVVLIGSRLDQVQIRHSIELQLLNEATKVGFCLLDQMRRNDGTDVKPGGVQKAFRASEYFG